MQSSKALLIGIAAALAAIAGLFIAQALLPAGKTSIESGTLLKQPREIQPFQLIDSSGASFGNDRLLGHWSLIFAGFTFCPDVCPNTLAILKALKTRLDAQQQPLQVIFLSVDPERDTPAKLDAYVHYFSPDFIGLSGSTEQLENIARSLSLVFARVPGSTPDSYTIDHSAALVLVDPQARVAGYFLPPHHVDAMARDLAHVLGGSH